MKFAGVLLVKDMTVAVSLAPERVIPFMVKFGWFVSIGALALSLRKTGVAIAPSPTLPVKLRLSKTLLSAVLSPALSVRPYTCMSIMIDRPFLTLRRAKPR